MTFEIEPPRRTVDAGDVVWQVFEHAPAFDRQGEPALLFLSDESVHLLRDVPADWMALSDEKLMALWDRR